MSRLRSNFKGGVITDSPLAFNATTANSSSFAGLPTVTTPDTLVVVLDPDGVGGVPEIVYVTDHQPGTPTTVTILRGQETADGGSVARQHLQGTKWEHSPTVKDYPGGSTVVPATSAPADAGAAGTSDFSARADHKHPRETLGSGLEYTTDLHVKPAGLDATHFATTIAPTFLSATAPGTPIEGDLWYVTSGTKRGRLAYYDGTNWIPFGGKMPFLWLTSTSVASVPDSATWANLTGMALQEDASSDGLNNTGAGLIVPSGLGGRWRITAGLKWGTSGLTDYNRGLALNVNGATVILVEHYATHSGGTRTGSKTLRLAAGNTVGMQYRQQDGTSVLLGGDVQPHFFQAEYLGP